MKRESRIVLSAIAAVVATPLIVVCAVSTIMMIVMAFGMQKHAGFLDVRDALLIILVSGVNGAALVRFSRWIARDHNIPSGLCANCGYDLRNSTRRCPECGHPIPSKQHHPAG